MKKYILGALLLSTTALYSVDAYAMPPVLGLAGGFLAGLAGTAPTILGGLAGASAFTIGSAAGAAIAGLGVGLGGLLLSSALSIGTNLLLSRQRSRGNIPAAQQADPGQRMVNIRQPVSNMEIVYGKVRKGGPVYFWETISGARVYGVIFAACVINSFVGVYADEREVTLDGSGIVQEDNYSPDTLTIDLYDGSSNVAPPMMLSNFAEWTSSHNMAGLSHAAITAKHPGTENFEAAFPTGQPSTITALVEGKKVYDPRTATTVYSNNAALVIADWLIDPQGLNSGVDWDDVGIQADISDEIVVDRDLNNIKRWQLNGIYVLGVDRESIRAELGSACDAFFYERNDGKVGFKVGAYEVPTITISDDDINNASYTKGSEGTNPVNAHSMKYTEASIGFVEQKSATIENVPSDESYEELELSNFWINSNNQACRLNKRYLAVEQAEIKASLTLGYNARALRGQRFFQLNHSEANISTVMEIDKLVRNSGGGQYEVQCHSVSSTDFDFDASTEEPERPKNTNLTTESSVPEPTNVSATSSGGVMTVSFDTAPRSSLISQLRYRQSGTTDWFEVSIPVSQNYQNVSGLTDGSVYQVQIRFITSTGRAGDWTPVDGSGDPSIAVTIVADSSAPNSAINVSATGGVGEATIQWADDNSSNYTAARIYRSTADLFSGASLVVTEYGPPNTADSFVDTGLSTDDYYYWVVSINGSGVAAIEVATGLISVT